MKIDYLREFIVFAKHLNFTAAAKELAMTQPGLSNHIANLEKEFGTNLIERGRTLTLTAAGHVFLNGCQATVAEYDKMCAAMVRVKDKQNPVRVYQQMEGTIAENVLSIMEATPSEFVDLPYTGSLLDYLLRDEVEVAFFPNVPAEPLLINGESVPDLEVVPIGFDALALCMENDNPLVDRIENGSLALKALQGANVVTNAAIFYDCWTEVVRRIMGDALELNFRLDPKRNRANLRFARYDGSVHICSTLTCHQLQEERPGLVVVDLFDDHPLTVEWDLVCKKANRRTQPLVEAARRLEISSN